MNFPFHFEFSKTGLVHLIFDDATTRIATDVEVTLWRALQEAVTFQAKIISDAEAKQAVAVVLMTPGEPEYLDPSDIGKILGETARFKPGTPIVLLTHGETMATLTKERKEQVMRELALYDDEVSLPDGYYLYRFDWEEWRRIQIEKNMVTGPWIEGSLPLAIFSRNPLEDVCGPLPAENVYLQETFTSATGRLLKQVSAEEIFPLRDGCKKDHD